MQVLIPQLGAEPGILRLCQALRGSLAGAAGPARPAPWETKALEDSFTGQKAGWFRCKAGIPVLCQIRLAPSLCCFIFTEKSQSCWPRPPTRRLSVTLCQVFAAQIPAAPGRWEARPVP